VVDVLLDELPVVEVLDEVEEVDELDVPVPPVPLEVLLPPVALPPVALPPVAAPLLLVDVLEAPPCPLLLVLVLVDDEVSPAPLPLLVLFPKESFPEPPQDATATTVAIHPTKVPKVRMIEARPGRRRATSAARREQDFVASPTHADCLAGHGLDRARASSTFGSKGSFGGLATPTETTAAARV
jgi:hypothetical protein